MKIGKSCEKVEERVCEDRISELPEDLLIKILWYVPTKDAVATMLLSKRWLSIWTMMIKLDYKDESKKKSVWWFLEKSLQLNKAPVIFSLTMELGPMCPTDVDVGKRVAKAIESRRVFELTLKLCWSADPTRLPESLYTCKYLLELNLSHKILVDFQSCSLSLPSLKILKLCYVVYKDEESLVRLLSSCPVLKCLWVRREKDDNVKKFTVKVPSLWFLWYSNNKMYNNDVGDTGRCLVIDTPALEIFKLFDNAEDYCSIGSMPCLNDALFKVNSYLDDDDRFLKSLSSVLSLDLCLTDEVLACCSAIKFKFSRLIKLEISPDVSDWLEPLMRLLENSPKLKNLVVDCGCIDQEEDLPGSWNKPSCVPGCLSSQLEIFEWEGFGNKVEEKEFLGYILTNSKCLKTGTISLSSTLEGQDLIIHELNDIPRVATASQLLFKK